MSMVPTATERSPWPPGFSFDISVVQILSGSRLSPASLSSVFGSASISPRRETLADQSALPVAAIGIEAVTDHPSAVAHNIGDDGNEARRHLGEIDTGVADRR